MQRSSGGRNQWKYDKYAHYKMRENDLSGFQRWRQSAKSCLNTNSSAYSVSSSSSSESSSDKDLTSMSQLLEQVNTKREPQSGDMPWRLRSRWLRREGRIWNSNCRSAWHRGQGGGFSKRCFAAIHSGSPPRWYLTTCGRAMLVLAIPGLAKKYARKRDCWRGRLKPEANRHKNKTLVWNVHGAKTTR